jgi:hypothetical protein
VVRIDPEATAETAGRVADHDRCDSSRREHALDFLPDRIEDVVHRLERALAVGLIERRRHPLGALGELLVPQFDHRIRRRRDDQLYRVVVDRRHLARVADVGSVAGLHRTECVPTGLETVDSQERWSWSSVDERYSPPFWRVDGLHRPQRG